jgi:nitrogen regulatory protein PII
MKQIIAVVKPFLAEPLISAVAELDVEEISIREVKGYGRQKNYIDHYGKNEYSLAFVPKVEISVWVQPQRLEAVLEKMTETARTGRLGDGKFFVVPVADQIDLFR